MASCQGKSEILSPPDPGGWGSNSPVRAGSNAFTAQRVHAIFERRPVSESGVYKGQGHDGDIKARRFGENAQSVSVADAVGPLVDCVERRGGDDDRVGPRRLGFAGTPAFAADRPASLRFELGYVDERQRRWRSDDLDGPAAVVSEFYEPSDFARRSRPAHDHVEDPVFARQRHLGALMRAANSLRWGRMVAGAVASRSLTRRRTAGQERTSCGASSSAARRA